MFCSTDVLDQFNLLPFHMFLKCQELPFDRTISTVLGFLLALKQFFSCLIVLSGYLKSCLIETIILSFQFLVKRRKNPFVASHDILF